MVKPKRPRDPNQLAKLIVGIATGEVDEKDPDSTKDQTNSRATPDRVAEARAALKRINKELGESLK